MRLMIRELTPILSRREVIERLWVGVYIAFLAILGIAWVVFLWRTHFYSSMAIQDDKRLPCVSSNATSGNYVALCTAAPVDVRNQWLFMEKLPTK